MWGCGLRIRNLVTDMAHQEKLRKRYTAKLPTSSNLVRSLRSLNSSIPPKALNRTSTWNWNPLSLQAVFGVSGAFLEDARHSLAYAQERLSHLQILAAGTPLERRVQYVGVLNKEDPSPSILVSFSGSVKGSSGFRSL